MRLLLLQFKRLGDVILTTPVLSALRAHRPDAHLTLALDATSAGLAPALDADHILIRRRNLWTPLALGRFDAVLDLTGNDRSALATLVSRAPRRITWTRFAKKPLRRALYTDFVDSSVRDRHTVDHHLDLLAPLGITAENVPPALRLPETARQDAARALTEAGIAGPFAVIHPGTARPEKYWLPDRWAVVIADLQSRLPVVLTGSDAPAERAHLDAILGELTALGLPHPVRLAGRLSLLATAAVLERASLVAAVDSAPVHLADALGVPVVALFGPTNPFHWRPRRATSRIVTAAGSGEFHPQFPKAPMDAISTEAVLAAIAALPQT